MLAVFGRCFDFHSPQKKKMRLNSGALVEAVNSFAFSNNFKTKSDFHKNMRLQADNLSRILEGESERQRDSISPSVI